MRYPVRSTRPRSCRSGGVPQEFLWSEIESELLNLWFGVSRLREKLSDYHNPLTRPPGQGRPVVKQHDERQLDEAGIHYAIGGLIETDERRSAAARAAHAHIERALAAMGDVRILEADHQ